jgi:hypothetical protein
MSVTVNLHQIYVDTFSSSLGKIRIYLTWWATGVGTNSRVFISALFKRASHYPADGQLGRRLVRITSLQREEKSLNLGRLITPSWQVSKPFRCISMIDLRGARKKSPTINIIWDTRKQEVSFYVLVPTSSSDFPAQMMFGPGCGFFCPRSRDVTGNFL